MLEVPADKMELIRPAVEGTERALHAALAADVERIVLTSSTAAIAYGHNKREATFTPADWTNLDGPHVPPYQESKTRAERRAWEIMDGTGRRGDLAVINPAGILGPLLDEDPGTSAALVATTTLPQRSTGIPRSSQYTSRRSAPSTQSLALSDPGA